jgi:predicted GIY-YIG superfamily endonuclease
MLQSEFIHLGFEKYLYAKNRTSLADSFTKDQRCGIYILHFENGEYYVGLATDVVNRHAQHRQNHSDIEYISFKQVENSNLIEVEKQTVYELEKLKKSLRNISLVSIINGDSDIDLIVAPEEQTKWKNYELGIESLTTPRFNYPELRKRYSSRFNKFKGSKYYKEIVEVLQKYILNCTPFPRRTEYSFWNCSCLPSGSREVFSRVTIFWQEVLTLYEEEFVEIKNEKEEIVKDLAVTIHVCKSKLFKIYNKTDLKAKYPTLEFTDHFYAPGGQDQQNLVMHVFDFLDSLEDKKILDSIKEFNLRLMRKGACISNRYHCFALADQALDISTATSIE